ncbi:MAG TPA: oligosaccharide flippase family protein [Gaiellales bacterium]|jgi:O-antigen/teichoic acid export membrane protein
MTPRIVLLGGFAASSAMNYGFSVVAARLLEPQQFGVVAVAQGILVVAGLVLGAGVPAVLAAELARGTAVPGRLVRGALLVNVAIGTAIACGLGIAALVEPVRRSLGSVEGVAMLAIAFPAFGVLSTGWSTAQGRGRFALCSVINIAESGTRLALGTLVLVLGASARGALAAIAAGALAGAATSAVVMHRLGRPSGRGLAFPHLGTAGAVFVAQLGQVLLITVDLIGLRVFGADSGTVGIYQAALILANAPYYVVAATVVPVLYSRASATADPGERSPLLSEALVIVALFTLPIELLLVAYPRAALTLVFPDAYGSGAAALRVLAAGTLCLTVLAVYSFFLQASARARISAAVLGVVALVEPVGLLVAVPRWSSTGAAAVFAVASGIALTALLAAGVRQGVQGLRPARAVAAGAACAVAAVAAVVALASAGVPLPLALAAGAVAYAALLARSGILRRIVPEPLRAARDAG